ncbi:UvrB/UvrC motif-containing protein [Clostridium sardiniense]|uniref:UvrB/UvrC motif-containing protein n=1 Tax=Clostridium sardiniense TaxID=29369 RepID=UPI003D32FCD4
MLCERCNKNEAKIHLIKSINGDKTGVWLCDNCAKIFGELSIVKSSDGKGLSFNKIINSLLENFPLKDEKVTNLVCKACGTTYEEVKEKRILGCNKCYYYFKDNLIPVIKRNQGNIEHIGKIPKREGVIIKKKKKIKKLKSDIEKAIVIEDYEKAAVIRDEIWDLEKELKEGVGNDK